MNQEQTKVGLLGVIAVLLAINTYFIATLDVSGGGTNETTTSQPPTNPKNPPANNQVTPNNPNSNLNLPQPNNATTNQKTTTVAFAESLHDFGNIKQNTTNTHVFKFTNTGDEPLIISNAKGSCGCTVPQYPKNPIPPGGTGEIAVEYKPGMKQGQQQQTVTVTANTNPPQTVVRIKANVETE